MRDLRSEEATLPTVNSMCSLQNKGHSGKYSQVDFQLPLSVVYLEQKVFDAVWVNVLDCVLPIY